MLSSLLYSPITKSTWRQQQRMIGSRKFILHIQFQHKYIAHTHVIDKAHEFEYTQDNAIKAVQSVHDG